MEEYEDICNEQRDWWTARVKQIMIWLEKKLKKNV